MRRYTRAELIAKLGGAGLNVVYCSSFVSLLVLLILPARFRARRPDFDPLSEFRIPRWLNFALECVMNIELTLMKWGVRLPVGGSLLVVAKETRA